jgi:hypothetical protein
VSGPCGDGLPIDVREFVLEFLHSAEQIEVLATLRLAAEREWSAAEVAMELRSSVGSVAGRLKDLATTGFLACSKVPGEGWRYRYAPQEPLAARVDAFFVVFASHRVAVYDLMFSRATRSARALADAFRLWKKE